MFIIVNDDQKTLERRASLINAWLQNCWIQFDGKKVLDKLNACIMSSLIEMATRIAQKISDRIWLLS